jgi:hypothetical protein
MTKLIAHRGLLNGPSLGLENRPDQIVLALSKGYDCEIDLRIEDGKFFLGHDESTYEVQEEFLELDGLWIHAKNLQALRWLSDTNLTYFWHQNDDFIITSNSYVWTFPGRPLTDKSVCVMPEWNDPHFETITETLCYGICSDYVEKISEILKLIPSSPIG